VTGKPRVFGYDDGGFRASASDVIRLRWSYALSLMRVSQTIGGPHPGLLMMDEPGQQKFESFSAFTDQDLGDGDAVYQIGMGSLRLRVRLHSSRACQHVLGKVVLA
jgi:hypothetical protein